MDSSGTPVYHNDYNTVIIFDAVSAVVALTIVAARFYVRHTVVKKVKSDDWLLLIGALFLVTSNVLDATSWLALKNRGFSDGMGLSDELDAICMVPYILAETFIRAAYAVFYLSVIPKQLDHLQWQRWTIIFGFAAYAVLQTVCAFVILFECGSPANINSTDPNVVCVNNDVLTFFYDVPYYLDAILDWLMALVTIGMVLKSSMLKKDKISAAFVLALGCVASILAVVAIALSYVDGASDNVADKSMAIIVDILATSETLTALLCLSLVAFKPLVRKYFGQYTITTGRGNSTKPIESQATSQEIWLIESRV